MITVERTRALAAGFARQRILVVGDLMLDQYLYGSVERISPEAPVPVVCVRREKKMAGGAANVAVNVRALEGAAGLAGVVGRDAAGDDLMRLLREQAIATDAVAAADGAPTIVKMRGIAERQQVCRVDWERGEGLAPAVVEALCERARRAVAASTGVVIEDYGKGVVCQAVVDAVLDAARRARVEVQNIDVTWQQADGAIVRAWSNAAVTLTPVALPHRPGWVVEGSVARAIEGGRTNRDCRLEWLACRGQPFLKLDEFAIGPAAGPGGGGGTALRPAFPAAEAVTGAVPAAATGPRGTP